MASRVVLVHGFTQTAASWPAELTDALRGDGHDVVAVDVPGHGRAHAVHADLREAARLLAAEAGTSPADFVGYSMGGRLALHVAVHHAHAVRRLVLIGATPGIEDPAERQQRRATDEELAASIERDGVEPFLERWLANPLFATLPRDAAKVESRLGNSAEGLAASLRLMGTGSQQPLWSALASIRVPALLLAGEHDEKYTELAHRMARAWGGPAHVGVVPGAGHAAHLERPDDVAARIAAFVR